MNPFDAIVAKAARELRAAYGRGWTGERLYLWACATRPDRDGFVVVASDCPEPMAACIRPCDNGASGYQGWSAVPFEAYEPTIRRALSREPILPRAAA